MSLIDRTISIIFEGDDQTAKAFKAVNAKMNKLSFAVEEAAQPFARMSDLVLDVDKALIGLSAAGLAYAYKKSVDYEGALVSLNKVLDENTESLDDASARALQFSDKYGQSFQDIIGQTTDFRQAGFDLSESLGLVENALELMIAGEVSASDSSDILKRTLKGLGEDADYAREIVAALNYVSNKFAADVPQLGEALARSAPLANQFGLSMQETLGILTPMIEVFQDAEMAATAFKTGLARLKDDTLKVEEAFLALGFSQEYVTNRNMLSTKDILLDVAGRFGDLDDNMKAVVSSALFGKEHFAKMSVVLDNMGKVAAVSGMDMADAFALLDKEIETRLNSSEQQILRFMNNLENVAAAVGDRFKAAATDSIGGLADIEDAIRRSVEAGDFDPMFDVLSDALDKLGKYFAEIAALLPDAVAQINWDELTAELEGISGAIGEFFAGLDLTTAEGLADAMQKAVDVLTGLVRVSIGIAEQFKPVFKAIGEGIEQVREMDRETAISFGNILGSAKLIVDAGTTIAGAFFIIQQSGAELENVFNALLGTSKFLWNALQVGFDSVSLLVVDAIDGVLRWATVMTNIPGMPDSWRESVAESRQELELFRDAVNQHQTEQIGEMMDGGAQAMRGFTGETRDAKKELDGVHESVKDTSDEIRLIPPSEFIATVDMPSFNRAQTEIDKAVPPEKKQTIQAEAKLDPKQMQAEMDLLETKVKAASEVMQTRVEWQAKLDIAEVEANAETVKALIESLADDFESTGQVISDLFGTMGDFMGNDANSRQAFFEMERQLEKENDLRERALRLQEELTKSQIKYMDARREKMDSGEALINVSMDGQFEPALEFMAREFIRYVQIWATEEGQEFLLGFDPM